MTPELIHINPQEQLRVSEQRYAGHLTYIDGTIPEGPAKDAANAARDWFTSHAKPFSAAVVLEIEDVITDTVILKNGPTLESAKLAHDLTETGCDALYILAVSSGDAVDTEIATRWTENRPDEAFTLNAFAAAATEALVTTEGARLCALSEEGGRTLLPHFSPGYDGWEIQQQLLLLSTLKEHVPELPLQALESGQVLPQKSLITVFGATRHKDRISPAQVPCTRCSLPDCHLRREKFQGLSDHNPAKMNSGNTAVRTRLRFTDSPQYAFSRKALTRWSTNALSLSEPEAGTRQATFTYNGSTCSDGGIPLTVRLHVTLTPNEDDFTITEMSCVGDLESPGFTQMCSYLTSAGGITKKIDDFKPLLHHPLSDALKWDPERNPAGCLCSQANRNHKWLIALQTIHFALADAVT